MTLKSEAACFWASTPLRRAPAASVRVMMRALRFDLPCSLRHS